MVPKTGNAASAYASHVTQPPFLPTRKSKGDEREKQCQRGGEGKNKSRSDCFDDTHYDPIIIE